MLTNTGFPISLLLIGMIYTSTKALRFLSIPVYTIFKKHALEAHGSGSSSAQQLATLNAGYIWMMVNCLSTAAYVLGMRKRIKLTNFKDFDSKS